jgi:hypothetical protein
MVTRTLMMAMTTSTSIRVKPCVFRFMGDLVGVQDGV